jgi:hypothetical protein
MAEGQDLSGKLKTRVLCYPNIFSITSFEMLWIAMQVLPHAHPATLELIMAEELVTYGEGYIHFADSRDFRYGTFWLKLCIN